MSTTRTEVLRDDLEQTRRHLADTVNRLSQQLNVPHRVKESAQAMPHRMKEGAQAMPQRIAQAMPERMKDRVTAVPAMGREHPRMAAAVGGAMLAGAGAAVWLLSHKRHG